MLTHVHVLLSQLGTSIGLAVTSSIATAISEKYASAHPLLLPSSPEVLMVGFRAAGWTCFAAAMLAFLVGLVGLRGIGVVGQRKTIPILAEGTTDSCAIHLTAVETDVKSLTGRGPVEAKSQPTPA
jgi:hypothetical protein